MKKIAFLFFVLSLLTSCIHPSSENQEIIINPSFDSYYCESRDLIKTCGEGFSSTFITCYELNEFGTKKGYRCLEGWKPLSERDNQCSDYFCYPDTDYCRLHGLISNPKIPRKEICGNN